ncbi:MAG TPA: DUF742 domain-containing protein [Candidatus Korarchaeota archaeon]|nr:DUF742 domain-containing protein [Candidatus Korarchaeota archaeon]
MRVTCPRCGRVEDVELTPELRSEAQESPAGAAILAIDHGDHTLVLMITESGEVASVEVAAKVERGKSVIDRLKVRPIPSKSPPSLDALERDEWRVFALCDGRRTAAEIASILGMPEGMVRLILESLRVRGYLSDILVEVV